MKPGQQSAAPAGQGPSLKELESTARQRMDKVIAALQHEMASLRTGRASINLFDGIQVEAYGSAMPLNHVATLHVPEPALITIQPYDVSQIGLIEKAIRNSDLGLNPSNDGKVIRVPIPNAHRRAPQGTGQETESRGGGPPRSGAQCPA